MNDQCKTLKTIAFAIVFSSFLFGTAETTWAHDHKASHSHGKDHAHKDLKKGDSVEKDQTAQANSSKDLKNSDVVINVNGMVCSFCTANIEKRFKKEKAIKDVVVNLDEKKVYLSFKDKGSLSDKQITSNIKKAGYNVVSIERN